MKRLLKTHRRILLTALLVGAIAVVLGFIYWPSQKKVSIIPSSSPSSSSSNKGAAANSTQSPNSNAPSSSGQSAEGSSPGASNNAKASGSPASSSSSSSLITPWGDFISSQNASTSSSGTTEVSVCNTSPGATCYIQFTNGNSIYKLAVETANSNGAASWTWNVKNSGLSPGQWQISAVASFNNLTKTGTTTEILNVSS